MAPMRARSVRRPSTGVRSSFQSPVCRITPCGVWNAVAKPWGTECVTGMNSTSNGPILRRSPSATGISSVWPRRPASSMRLLRQPEGEGRAVDRERQLAEQVGQRRRRGPRGRGWRCSRSTRSAFSRSQVKSGRTRSMPEHVELGEHEPAVEEEELVRRCSRTMQLRPISPRPPRKVMVTGAATRRTRPAARASPRPRPRGRRAPARSGGGTARSGARGTRIATFTHSANWAWSRLSYQYDSNRRGVELPGPVVVALLERGDRARAMIGPHQWVAVPITPTAPTASSGQRHGVVAASRPRSRPGPRR